MRERIVDRRRRHHRLHGGVWWGQDRVGLVKDDASPEPASFVMSVSLYAPAANVHQDRNFQEK